MREFVLSKHAESKIVSNDEYLAVLRAANNPSVSYGVSDKRNAGRNRQERHIRDGIVAVVDADTQTVITFYANVVETDLRPDQTDEDAQAYAAKRAADKAADKARREQKRAARKERDRAFTMAQKGKKQ